MCHQFINLNTKIRNYFLSAEDLEFSYEFDGNGLMDIDDSFIESDSDESEMEDLDVNSDGETVSECEFNLNYKSCLEEYINKRNMEASSDEESEENQQKRFEFFHSLVFYRLREVQRNFKHD